MTFAELTWDDLNEWAGSRVVTRGKGYRRAVEDLRLTADGRLLAWVRGGDRYVTVVSMDKAGGLASVCTCPYGIACKHAVATVLTYLDKVQAGESVPPAEAVDERLERLAEEEDLDEADEVEDDETAPSSIAVPKRLAGRKPTEDPDAAMRRYLESLSPAVLLEFARELAADFPEVRQRILDRAELQSGDVAKLIATTRREIEKVSAEPGWTRHWSNERHIPDYSRVQKRLESLLAAGHADEVVALGEEVLRRGIQQVEMSDDEGETGREIAGCMAVVFRALDASSLTGAKRLLWEIDARLRDHYCILDGIQGPLEDPTAFTPADWSAVADELARRMEGILVTAQREANDSDRNYNRQAVMHWLLDALRHADREGEIAAILEGEAEITHCYVELVDHLLAEKQSERAADWARKGFERTIDKLPGIAWSLEGRLRDLAVRKRDRPLIAAFRAMEFFNQPEVERYEALRKAAASLGFWDAIRPMLLSWLETGIRPDVKPVGETPRRRRRGAMPVPPAVPCHSWPLPATGLDVPGENGRFRFFPDTSTLIAIAISEGRHDDVLRWYSHDGKPGGYRQDYQGETVAEAVQATHPDEALAIWKRIAVSQIAMTKPAAYQMAGGTLRKMRVVYQGTGRLAEWDGLIVALRAENARKPRMIEVLDGLEGKRSRIIQS